MKVLRRAWRGVTWTGVRLVAYVVIAGGLFLLFLVGFGLLVSWLAEPLEGRR